MFSEELSREFHDAACDRLTMGMRAEIIAIGPFTKEVAEFLDYPAERYNATPEGAIISRRLFGIGEGSTASRLFAKHLGISNVWDFNQHKLDNRNIDFVGLREFVETHT